MYLTDIRASAITVALRQRAVVIDHVGLALEIKDAAVIGI